MYTLAKFYYEEARSSDYRKLNSMKSGWPLKALSSNFMKTGKLVLKSKMGGTDTPYGDIISLYKEK
jgi:hypothetical protein